MKMTAESVSTETAAAVSWDSAIEMHGITNPGYAVHQMRREIAAVDTGVEEAFDRRFLPLIAEQYNISRNLRDFVVVPVVIMASDIPNRNLVAFPFERLSEFSPDMKMLAYQTWRFAPTYQDHKNDDHTAAKGLVLDVGMTPMPNVDGDLWKVTALCAFDRRKDPRLVNDILTKRKTSYSMGAYVTSYECSICGSTVRRPNEPACMHIPATRNRLNVFQVDGLPTLAHWNCGAFSGFEVSCLSTLGAYPSTDGTDTVIFGE